MALSDDLSHRDEMSSPRIQLKRPPFLAGIYLLLVDQRKRFMKLIAVGVVGTSPRFELRADGVASRVCVGSLLDEGREIVGGLGGR